MQISRIRVAGQIGFAARLSVAEQWVPLSHLGFHAASTASVIVQSDPIRAALARRCRVPAAAASASAEPALQCPIVGETQILAAGLNYRSHIAETKSELPARPVIFAKYPSSLNGPFGDIVHDPSLTSELDYEAELAVVVGTPARRLTPENALDHVFGYCVANDVSARDWQRLDGQFSRSKGYDSFCPIGPWITTADEVANPQSLNLYSKVNGESRQVGSTAEMVFSVVDLLVYLSASMTLRPGDVILTGTPAGVGAGFLPPRFLQVGDLIECGVEGLEVIRNRVTLDPMAASSTSSMALTNSGS